MRQLLQRLAASNRTLRYGALAGGVFGAIWGTLTALPILASLVRRNPWPLIAGAAGAVAAVVIEASTEEQE